MIKRLAIWTASVLALAGIAVVLLFGLDMR